jgi:hypothetical protein
MDARQLTITKVDHAGHAVLSYPGERVYQDEEVIVVRCRWTRPEPLNVDGMLLEEGDIFMEHYYAHEWFNVFQIHDASGRLKGWYCNITEPAEATGDEVRWLDLALDLLVFPDGQQAILDEDEFEALHPSPEHRAQVSAALQRLQAWAREGHRPFFPLARQGAGGANANGVAVDRRGPLG